MVSPEAANGNGIQNKKHPSPIAFAHAVLRTSPDHYDEMVQFYIDVLNAETIHETPDITFLRYDDEHHRVAIAKVPQILPKAKEQIHCEVDHLAYTFATLTDLAQTYAFLKGRKHTPIWSVNHGPTTSLYYRDPDSNKVELQVDNFDTAEEADAFMRGPLFAMNPIGTDLDADEWAAYILLQAGEDGQEGLDASDVRRLKTRREIGERFTLPSSLH